MEFHNQFPIILSTNQISISPPQKHKKVEIVSDEGGDDGIKGDFGEYYEEDLLSFTPEQLRNTFKLFGLVVPPESDNADKDELIGLLMNSGRISKTPEGYEVR